MEFRGLGITANSQSCTIVDNSVTIAGAPCSLCACMKYFQMIEISSEIYLAVEGEGFGNTYIAQIVAGLIQN